MPHAQSGCQIASIRRAVDDRLIHIGIVKYRCNVVDDLFNGQRRRRQVRSGIVVAGHPHSAVLDHDDVESGCGRSSTQPAIVSNRGHPRPARDDHQGVRAALTGADVEQIE
jgi:hypothetical protein